MNYKLFLQESFLKIDRAFSLSILDLFVFDANSIIGSLTANNVSKKKAKEWGVLTSCPHFRTFCFCFL